MAKQYTVSFSIAGSDAAINEAILLMASNVTDVDSRVNFKRCKDALNSWDEYRDAIDRHLGIALAGHKCTGFPRSSGNLTYSSNNSFIGGPEKKVCSIAERCWSEDGFGEDDFAVYLDSLLRLLNGSEDFEACVIMQTTLTPMMKSPSTLAVTGFLTVIRRSWREIC